MNPFDLIVAVIMLVVLVYSVKTRPKTGKPWWKEPVVLVVIAIGLFMILRTLRGGH